MKVGILTFHECANYGAVFQAYALQKVLNEYTDCELIDYRSPKISAGGRLQRMEKNHSLKGRLVKCFRYPFYARKRANFDAFLKTHCPLSAKTYTADTIAEVNNIYDTLISGSDQVFNLNLTGGDYTFYLDFAAPHIKKVTYAASMGNYIFDPADEKAKRLLQAFDHVSVREQVVCDNVAAFADVPSTVVVDPTFLLEKSDWQALEKPLELPEKYIAVYFVTPEKPFFRYVKKLAKKTGLPVYYVNYNPTSYYPTSMHNLRDVPPEQFLYLLDHATYVVTNSFHGTALSIGFEKEFYVLLDPKREKGNQRMLNILGELNLQHRGVALDADAWVEPIDYEPKRAVLPQKAREAKAFLQQAGVIKTL